ncbi:uncharacterized transporter C757.13 [Aspergillus awamori]|uniref:Uncharacterized transporter C757.13 n=1 Tax=Aspergillus awamori TaxID=105351 RepID=A0A401L6W7_ASPAW|nr:uncharacterized transporter C757.13 [Aspergillus awamori]
MGETNTAVEMSTLPLGKMEIEKEVDGAAAYLAQSTSYPPMTLEVERKLLRKIDCILVPMIFTSLVNNTPGRDQFYLSVYVFVTVVHCPKSDTEEGHHWDVPFFLPRTATPIRKISFFVLHRLVLLSSADTRIEKLERADGAEVFYGDIPNLGYLEAIIVPTISLIVAGFYKKAEQPPRNAIVFAAFSSVINGFLSWAVGHIPDSAPLAIWQYLYLIVVWSIIAFVLLPESPMNAFFFTDQERFYATQRLTENQTGIINKEWKREQALEAVLDAKTWILFSFNIAINIPNGGLTTFSGILINNLGFTAVKASLLNMPTGVMSTLSAFSFSWLAARWTNRRCLVTMMACCLPIAGSALVYSLPRTNVAGQIVGIYLLYTYFGPTLDLTCEEFTFVEEPVEQGISLGRRGGFHQMSVIGIIIDLPASKPAHREMVSLDEYSGRWVFLNLTVKNYLEDTGEVDYDSDNEDTVMQGLSGESDDALQLRSVLSHPLSEYSHSESYLLQYFIQSIGPDCSLSSIDNPYITLLTPLAFCHPALRNAMVSVAANQLRLLGDARYANEAALYKNRAIQGLQQAVELQNIDDGIIGTILMLCFYDISDKCDSSWVKHLEAGLDLLDCLPCSASSSQGLRRFFQMYFVAHAIMRRTASPGMMYENGRYGWSENDNLDEIDTIMGCSRRLMGMINDISDLPSDEHMKTTNAGPADTYISRANRLACSLINLAQTLPPHLQHREDIARIAETKRLAALLYLIERVGSTTYRRQFIPRTDKRTLVNKMIDLIQSLPDSATLLWPLYVLGQTALDDQDHRRFVMDRLERIERTRNLGSVRRARTAMKDTFRIMDMRYTVRRRDGRFGNISLA